MFSTKSIEESVGLKIAFYVQILSLGGDMQVNKYMTKTPSFVSKDEKVLNAKKMMYQLGCTHLPVLEAGNVVGVISERDILYLFQIESEDIENLTVEEAMTEDFYAANVDDDITSVSRYMADNRIGSAIILDHNNKLAGIYTYTDALKAIVDIAA